VRAIAWISEFMPTHCASMVCVREPRALVFVYVRARVCVCVYVCVGARA
jgi:hypothetical protein